MRSSTRDVLAARGLVEAGLAVTLMPELLAGGLPGIEMVALDGRQPSRSLLRARPRGRRRYGDSALAFLAALRSETGSAWCRGSTSALN